MLGRIRALVLLGFALVVSLLRRLLRPRTDGLARFARNYRADHVPPLSGHDRELLAKAHRCIACGRCDRGEGERIAASRGKYPGVMQLVLSAARATPDFRYSVSAWQSVPEAELRAKEAICPVEVPISDLARFVQDKASS